MSHYRNLALLAALSVASADRRCARHAALRPGRTECPLLIDDTSPSDLLDASPLQPLKCLHTGGPEGAQCIYTAPSFHDGFSIATSSAHAADLVGMGSLDDLASLHFSAGAVEDAYEVRDLPGKGKGVVASRLIEKGEVFMVDYPAILVEGELMAAMNVPSRKGVLRGAVEGLGEGRERVMGLARSSGGDELDLFVTNGCGVEGFGVSYTGLFPEVARMNHDCQPNAYFRFSARTMMMEVLSYKDIVPGEEITINYAFLGMPYKERQSHLRETWSFTCTCPLCTAPAATRSASDARRHQIAQLRREISQGAGEEVVRAAERAVELCEEEGLEALLPDFWGRLAKGLVGIGRVEEAEVWAGRALGGWRRFKGEGRKVEEVEELLGVIRREMGRRG